MMLDILAFATLVRLAVPAAVPADVARLSPARWAHAEPPGVRIWTSHGEVYQRGERVRVYFRTERDAYVTILRVDTDGRVRILFPRQPWEDNFARGGRTYDAPNYGQHDAFIVDDAPGVGYMFAVASSDPFLYEPFTREDHWDLQLISDGRIHGDPYASLEELIQHVIPEGYTDYDTHLLPYHVERRYDYPRFLCYDCHAYVPWTSWNPYSLWCRRFSLFVYSDPYYYYPSYWKPGRVYGGTRVVFVRPGREGRYVFKSREDQSVPGVTYRDRRRGDEARTPADRGVRGVDIGGVGSVPAPGRRTVESPGADRRAVGGSPAERIPVVGGGRRQVEPRADQQGPGQAREPLRPAQRPRGIYIEPRAEPQPDRRPEARAEPKPESRPEPRARPAPDHRPEPRAEPQPAHRPEPRAEPRPEHRPEPRAEPRPQHRPEPQAVSRPEPRESPRPSPELIRRRPD